MSELTTINKNDVDYDLKDAYAERAANKVTAWQATPDDTHFPSEKLVKDTIDAVTSEDIPYDSTAESHTAGSVGEALTSQSEKIEAVEEKISDANLENLTVGTADGLLADTGVTDQEPYLFRKAPDKARRLTDKIVGGTIAWNQLEGGNERHVQSSSAFVWGTLGMEGMKWTSGHKYLVALNGKTVSGGHIGVRDTVAEIVYRPTLGYSIIYACSENTSNTFIQGNWPEGDTDAYINVFDLTQMFGSTIADQIYAMETATAGAGVAFFKSLFPKDYYAYNAGELMSVNTSAHVTVEKNLFGQVIEQGGIDNTTGNNYDTGLERQLRNNGYCHVKGGSEYTLSADVTFTMYNVYVYFYDSNKTYLSYTSTPTSTVLYTFTTPNNCAFIRFKIYSAESGCSPSGMTNVQIEIGNSKTAYEPYESHTYPLDSSLTLRGIPKLDANNKVYYDGDTYESDGKVTRRYGVVDLGTLSWSRQTVNTINYFVTPDSITPNIKSRADGDAPVSICSKYKAITTTYASNLNNDKEMFTGGSNSKIYIRDDSYTDDTTFTSSLSGVYLVYELATPTTETADPFINPQICSPYGTEEYVDEREVAVPVGHDTFYHTDLKGRIEGLPDDFSTLIAPTEAEFKATRAYTANDFLIVNNVLYKATTSIASGATITVGTNVTATTIADVLKALLS